MDKQTLKLLLIEDNPDDELLILRELERGGFTVSHTRVETEKELKQALNPGGWDAVITDYNLPNFSGPEALEVFKRHQLDIPFIVVSGQVGEETAVDTMKAGAHDYIPKDNLARLIPAIKRELKDADNRRLKKRIEMDLKESEKRYRALWNKAPAAYHILDRHGIIKAVNQTELDMFGYSREEMVGRPIFEFVQPEQRADAQARFQRKLAGENLARSKERIYLTKGGKEVYVSIDDILEYDSNSRVSGVRSTMYDITQRVRAEKALKASQAALIQAQHIAQLGNWDWNIGKNTLAWSDETYRIFGLNPQRFTVTYEAFLNCIHPDDLKAVTAAINEALNKKSQLGVEYRIIQPGGSERIIRLKGELQIGAEGAAKRMFGTVQNITKEKAEERFRQARGDLLKLLSESFSRRQYLNAVLELVKEWSGCANAGIRILNENREVPYEVYYGFDRNFWQSEGCLNADSDQCACTRVITGNLEPQDKLAATTFGSFRSNNTLQFFKGLSDTERRRYRGTCLEYNYASLAVIPIKYGHKILGAIHMADNREGLATEKTVRFIEELSPLIGEAINKFEIQDELKRNYESQGVLSEILGVSLERISLTEALNKIILRLISVPWIALEAKAGVWLISDNPGGLVLTAERGLPVDLKKRCRHIKNGECLCGRAAATGQLQYAREIDAQHEIRHEGMEAHGHYCVPIIAENKVIGVMNFYVRAGHDYSKRKADFLRAAANIVAGMIERKKRDDELKLSKENYQMLVDNAGEAVITLDTNGKITFANQAFFDLSGYSRKELPDLNFLKLVKEDDYEKLMARFRDRRQDNRSSSTFEFDSVTKYGYTRRVNYTATPIIKENKIRGVQVIARDITETSLLQERIREAKDHYLQVIDTITDAICVVDKNYKILSFNRVFAHKVRMDINELKDQDYRKVILNYEQGLLDDFCCPNCNGRTCYLKNVFVQGEIIRREYKTTTKEGRVKYKNISFFPAKDKNNKTYQVVITYRDITERKQAEEEVRRLHEFNQRILDNVPVSIMTIDQDGIITSVNKFYHQFSNTAKPEGRNIFNIPFFEKEELAAGYRRLLKDGKILAKSNCVTVNARGEHKFLNIVALPLYRPSGRIEGAISMAIDNTAEVKSQEELKNLNLNLKAEVVTRKRAEEEIRRLSELNQKILDNSPTSIVLLDIQGRIIAANKMAKQLMEKPDKPLAGRKLVDTREISNNPRLLKFYDRLLAQGEPFYYENLPYSEDGNGNQRHLNVIAVPLYDIAGKQEGAISMALDNTDAIKAKEALEDLNRTLEKRVRERTSELFEVNQKLAEALDLKVRFIADASHELRTPLTVIQGNLDLAVREAEHEKTPVPELYSLVMDEVERMTRTLGDLSMLTNIDSGREQLNRENVDLKRLVNSVGQSLKVLAEDKKIALIYKKTAQKVNIMGDEAKLEKLLLNIARNAIKYTPPKGRVKISVDADEHCASLIVEDNGIGISEKDLPLIFERFFRSDKSRATEEGSGLGLAIAKWIVDAHGGRIDVRSREGAGSTFNIRLPYDYKKQKLAVSLF